MITLTINNIKSEVIKFENLIFKISLFVDGIIKVAENVKICLLCAK